LFNIPHFWVRYVPLMRGYDLGISFFAQIRSSGFLQRLTEGGAVLGLMVLGSMTATMVNLQTKMVVKLGPTSVNLQKILDAIMPKLLPLGIVLLCWALLRRGWSATRVLVFVLAMGIVGALVGFF